MSQSKLKLTITKADVVGMYCVELSDHHCNYCCVYEPTVEAAMKYAEAWFADADKREEANQIHSKAIKQMIELDRKAGITTSMSDGLD